MKWNLQGGEVPTETRSMAVTESLTVLRAGIVGTSQGVFQKLTEHLDHFINAVGASLQPFSSDRADLKTREQILSHLA